MIMVCALEYEWKGRCFKEGNLIGGVISSVALEMAANEDWFESGSRKSKSSHFKAANVDRATATKTSARLKDKDIETRPTSFESLVETDEADLCGISEAQGSRPKRRKRQAIEDPIAGDSYAPNKERVRMRGEGRNQPTQIIVYVTDCVPRTRGMLMNQYHS